ncbi:MAG: hypothetical protein EXR76_13980 [Myxococcales bacterium]|nr:hypothetical protein [Myxococcales bacterium]
MRPRPRVTSVRFGFNPNSSSLGIDVTFLMLGLAGVSIISATVSALLPRLRPPPAPRPETPTQDASKS